MADWIDYVRDSINARLTTAFSGELAYRVFEVPFMNPALVGFRGRERMVQFVLGEAGQRGFGGNALLQDLNLYVGAFVSYPVDDPQRVDRAGKELRLLWSYVLPALHGYADPDLDFFCSPWEKKQGPPPPSPAPLTDRNRGTPAGCLWEMAWFQATIGMPATYYAARTFDGD